MSATQLFETGDRGAELSPDGIYRYRLWRVFPDGAGTVLFVMLNPSTADADVDDPTIRRCIGFARRWGYKRLEVANLFAFRATDPGHLTRAVDPIGPGNDRWIADAGVLAHRTVAAWGAHPFARYRAAQVADLLPDALCLGTTLGTTVDGHPRHPLYVPSEAELVPWRSA